MLCRSLCLATAVVVLSGSPTHAESQRIRPSLAAPDRSAVDVAPRLRVERSLAAGHARPQADYPVPPVYDILSQSYPPPAPPPPDLAAAPDQAVDAALQPLRRHGPDQPGETVDDMIVDGVRDFLSPAGG